MTRTPSLAKISRPSPSGVFPRQRLFRLLDHSAAQSITWVTGPPGSGKTTLVSSYLDARKLPSLWYQIDEGDADIASFFYHLGLAAKRAAPRKRRPLPLLTPEYLQGIPTFSRRYFENLCSRLAPPAHDYSSSSLRGADTGSRIKQRAHRQRFIIVFDNYQEVPEGSPFHDVLREGLSQVPDGISIILISRRDPPNAYVRLRANRLIEITGWDELRFTLDETKRMIRLHGQKGVPLHVLEQVHKITAGWAAGIVLLMEGMKARGTKSVPSEAHVSKEIFHYFAKEIFEKAEPGVRDFLLKTSFFPQMSSKMAETLTGNPQAQRILSDLNLRNYFTQRHESEIGRYQYHVLFREFLQVLARETFDSKDLLQIEKEAAMILEANGQTEETLELLIKLEDWPDVIRVILQHAQELITQGRGQTLEGWIKSLPESMVQEEPWLLYWAGVCRLPFSPEQSHDFFEKALNQFRAKGHITGIFLSLSGLFDSTIYGGSNYKPLDQTIALLDKVIKVFSYPSFEIEARLTAGMLLAMVVRQPQHPDIEMWASKAFALSQKSQDINVRMQALQALFLHWLYLGEFPKAESVLDSFRELVRSHNVTPFFLSFLRALEANYYSLTAAFEGNQKAVTEGLELTSTTGVHLYDIFLLGYGAVGALSSGDMATATEYLKIAHRLDNVSAWGKSCHYMGLTWASLIQGDLSNALSNAETGLKSSMELGMPQTEAICTIGHAIALHELNTEERATDQLAKGINLARSSKFPLGEFMCLLAEAQFAFDKGDEPSGLTSLRKALSIGREKGYVNTYYWRPTVMVKVCKKALEAGIEVQYVQNLIRKRNLVADSPPYECEQWPWPLRLRTLGRFELLKDGRAVQFSGKLQKKPLDMLKALIALGGSEVKEVQLADLFWPDADGDAAHSDFTTTLSRLRRLLGHETAIRFQEGKATLDPRYCWVDAWAFERVFWQAESVMKGVHDTETQEDKREEILRLAEKAVDIYKGHFLPADEKYSWTTSYREGLRTKFIRLMTKFGDYLQQTGQWEKAVEHYQRSLDVDEFAEEYYQNLMMCYNRLGQPVKAIEVYRRCRKTLSAVFEIEPSPKTQSIYQKIIKNVKIKSSNAK